MASKILKPKTNKQIKQFKKRKYILISEQILSPGQNTGKPNLDMCVNNNSKHLLSTTLNAVQGLTHLILTTLYCKNYHSIHFTEEETKTQKGSVICHILSTDRKQRSWDFKNTNEILI